MALSKITSSGISDDAISGNLGYTPVTPTQLTDGLALKVGIDSSTGAAILPVGTTAQRPGVPAAGMFRMNSTIGEPEWYDSDGSQWLAFSTAQASGGTVSESGGYRYHVFTSSDAFVVSGGNLVADVLVVAGGGGGGRGSNFGGGGGAGGLVFQNAVTLPKGSNSIVVGSGGAGATSLPSRAANGNTSSIVAIGLTAVGGGGGGAQTVGVGFDGGSGGGGGYAFAGGSATQPSQIGSSGLFGYGRNGGTGNTSPNGGGGGGGATEAGFTADPCNGGAGLNLSTIFGTAVGETGIFAGGGGGSNQAGRPQPVGGVGGGGDGMIYNISGQSTAGQANTGGGGGAGGNADTGKSGGSGIVIIRYPI